MTNLDALRRKVSSTLVIAARKWRRTSHGVLSAFNVSEACATPLLTASRLGEAVRQVTLADYIGIEGPSLVRLLDQLCAAGLMRRDEDPADRRAKTVVLTPQGRFVTQKMEDELVTLRAQALKGISRSDLETTLRVLSAFTAGSTEESQATDAANVATTARVEKAGKAASAGTATRTASSAKPAKAPRAKPRRAALKVRRSAR